MTSFPPGNVLVLATGQVLMLAAIVLSRALAAILGGSPGPRTRDAARRRNGDRHPDRVAAGVRADAAPRAPFRPAVRLKVQTVNEFCVFGLATTATLSAGWLYDRVGWTTLNFAVVPALLAALLAATGIGRRLRRAAQAA